MGPAPPVAAVRRAVRTALTSPDALAALRRDAPGAAPQDGQPVRVLVACSGGADSLALAAAVAFEAPRLGIAPGLVTVDHGLQPGSGAQSDRVAGLGYELGFDPVEQLRVRVTGGGGPEAAARAARYAALDAAAGTLDALLLLGHTLDDQAETVLLGLGRGSGPRSVAGMAAVDGRRLRPLLELRRATTRAACAALGLDPWDDPHNDDSRYRRVRLRLEVLPLLEDVLGGGVAEALARTAQLQRDDLAALDAWAVVALAQTTRPATDSAGSELEAGELAALPQAVRTRVLRTWLAECGAGPLTAERTAAVDALVTRWHGQGAVGLPGGVAVRRMSGRLVTSRTRSADKHRSTQE